MSAAERKADTLLRYRVEVAGGFGPDTWDEEFFIEAEHFGDAYARACAQMGPRGEWDFVCIAELGSGS